jgi:hypothetical protein
MAANQRNPILAYWLVPAEPMRGWLGPTTAQLASQFEAPLFEPHVTIYAAGSGNEDPEGVMDTVLCGCAPFRLTVRDIQRSEEFTKTLFVQFEPSTELAKISRKLREASGANDEYELNPHLSLIYKTMTAAEQTELTASIRLPFTEILFDTVKAVVCPTTPIRSGKDVETWRVVASRRLTG